MAPLADLHRSIQATLAGKRLGSPVFVRYQLQGPARAGKVPNLLAWLTGVVRDWIGQPVEQVYAQGQVKNHHVHLLVEFRDGPTAVVGWSAGPGPGNVVDLMVVGNHGALYHDAPGPFRDAEGKGDDATLALVERALASGRPEPARR